MVKVEHKRATVESTAQARILRVSARRKSNWARERAVQVQSRRLMSTLAFECPYQLYIHNEVRGELICSGELPIPFCRKSAYYLPIHGYYKLY